MDDPIIVSAFIDLQRENNVKSMNDYLNYSVGLMNVDQRKIIFLEQHIIDKLQGIPKNTTIVQFDKSQLHFKFDDVRLPLFANKDKDTKEYLSIQLNKTFWVMEAAKLSNTTQFIWIDFGINHVCADPNYLLLKKSYDKIRIPGCIDPQTCNGFSLDAPNWFFCGGLFGGHINNIKILHESIIKHVICLLEQNLITWEVNIWMMAYKKMPYLFDWYYADHNCGMINNY